MKRSPIGRRKAAQKLVATVAGAALFAVALFATMLSFLAPFGYPFDAVSSYRWYWTVVALAAGLSWGLVRGRNMMIASALVGLINLIVILPSLGAGPKGGKISNAVVAWANVAGDDKALQKVLREAERQKAGLVLIAKAPQSILTQPQGWNVIERPNFGDPTSIAVLSRGRWQSSTIPGEPTIARTAAGDLTIIATLPPPSKGGPGVGAARESQLNRAAVRAGDQEGPVAVLGDFGVAPWDGAMSQFRKYGNVTRVRCGGFMGTTVSQAFGLIGVAHDHAYVRDLKVTHCRLGGPLTGGGHRAIFLYLAPLDPAK
jgi:endonuclease/exonuclease/phosphatase (EEP) superfamily protein YafD